MGDAADRCDVLVVGAGPGGIAAAVTAAEAGRGVTLIDDNVFAGGQIWRSRGGRPPPGQARRWLGRLEAQGGVIRHLTQSRVVAARGSKTLLVETPAGPRWLSCEALITATGARELFLPFPGWTLPGVVGAGGMQALIKSGMPVAGKRVVVAGSGPLLLAVAALLRAKGARVPMILEQASAARVNRFAASLVRTPAKLWQGLLIRGRLWATEYSTDSYPLEASRTAAGLRVEYLARGRAGGVECDFLACGFNLIPNAELPRMIGCDHRKNGFVRVDAEMRTSVAGVFAVGELTGVGGVEKSLLEGRIAGNAAAGDAAAASKLRGARDAAVRFAARLDAAFELRPELMRLARPDTIVCRCEDVSLAGIRGRINSRDAKLQTRCGMGPCQGRVCGPIVERLLHAEPPGVRPPIFATPLSTLAAAPFPECE